MVYIKVLCGIGNFSGAPFIRFQPAVQQKGLLQRAAAHLLIPQCYCCCAAEKKETLTLTHQKGKALSQVHVAFVLLRGRRRFSPRRRRRRRRRKTAGVVAQLRYPRTLLKLCGPRFPYCATVYRALLLLQSRFRKQLKSKCRINVCCNGTKWWAIPLWTPQQRPLT